MQLEGQKPLLGPVASLTFTAGVSGWPLLSIHFRREGLSVKPFFDVVRGFFIP